MSTDPKADPSDELPITSDSHDVTGDIVGSSVGIEDLHTVNILAPGMSSSTLIAGRYQLLEKIGEGGMGEVWVAQQTQPVKRRVAIKLIRTGMGSKAFLARFDQERQALAMMNHPNIAKVLDAGVATNGAPYLVMEYVSGEQLTKYCDSARMSPKDRLELFVPICQAVQHAHQKGIVHRDLKPANILVSSVDGRPVPKVIDFGVAKATGSKLTDQTFATDFGAVVGTLEYMAPEQAGKSNEDIDTRADIYSLGVILYELLTGLRPIDGERLRKAALSEMIRIIREDDPSRPSTRLSTSASLSSLAAMRQTEPSKLMAELRGELDWVVMKCLEKSRDRRYDTANDLARDIQRYLSHQPVDARPPSSSYRIRKFLERNRSSALAACLCAVLFLAGFIGTALGWLEARRQTAVARVKSQIAEAALLGETQARQVAETANRQAFLALESFTSSLMEDLLGSKDTLTATDRSVLENAQQQWSVFAESKGASKEARMISAEGATNLSKIQSKLGMNREAEANDRKSLTIWESLHLERPDDFEVILKLAKSHQNLGSILRVNGSREEAGQHFRSAVKYFEQLIAKTPDSEPLQIGYANSCVSSGNSARDFGKWEEAERWYLMAFAAQEKLLEQSPGKLLYREDLVKSRWGLAALYKRQGKFSEAKGHYRRSIDDIAKLISASPESRKYRLQHANLRRELGVLLSDDNDDAAAAELLAESVSSLSKIVDEFPSVPLYRLDLGRARRDYAKVLGYLHEETAAAEQFAQAIAINTRLTEADPTNLPYQSDHGITYKMFADFLADNGKLAESLVPMSQSVQILTTAHIQDPKIVLTKRALCRSHEYRAVTLDLLERHGEALNDWDQVLKLCDDDMRHIHRSQRADSLFRSGKVEPAMSEMEELSKIESENPKHWIRFSKLYALASEQLPLRKTEYVNQAIAMLKKAIDLGFDDFPRLKEDPELAPLNTHPDFIKLLE